MTDAEIDLLFRRESDARTRAYLKGIATPPPIVTPPASKPLTAASLVYQRSFRLPRTPSNGQAFDFGGSHLALTPGGTTMFVGNRQSHVAEISIPSEDGAFAEYVQGFADPTKGDLTLTFGDTASLSGLLVVNEQLMGTVSVYYDANNTQRGGHFVCSRDLTVNRVSPFSGVWKADHTGYVAGYLAHVPRAWQDALYGTALTGQFGIPIVSRTSLGPAAFTMNPISLGMVIAGTINATPLVYYPNDHPTLGKWDGSNEVYGGTARCGGLALIDDDALFFGRNGMGPFCYGNGTSMDYPYGTVAADGEPYCFDPASSDKGQHAYPYRYQIWSYRLADFARVAAGEVEPWTLIPDVWELKLPTDEPTFRGIGGVAIDREKRLLYVSQLSADQDGYAYRAMIHVFTVT